MDQRDHADGRTVDLAESARRLWFGETAFRPHLTPTERRKSLALVVSVLMQLGFGLNASRKAAARAAESSFDTAKRATKGWGA